MPIPKAIIIGYPVKHARSPLIHGFWLETLGIPGAYERAEVKPGEVGAFLRALSPRGYVGGNVTVPHKEEAFAACDQVTEAASNARAVNTFWFEAGALVGDNTDGSGFVAHLDQTHPDWHTPAPRILILGAGGAARGLVTPLLAKGPVEILIANRSRERCEALIGDIHSSRPSAPLGAIDWDKRNDALGGIDLFVNTTSLGMGGQPPLDIALGELPERAVVADIVYVPLKTPLLVAARDRGLRVLDGLGMLLHQAAPGFERWFGVKPEVTSALRDHILADLVERGR